MKVLSQKLSLTETINTMFSAMKYGLKNGLKQTVKFFIYDLANPLFYDFSPKFFVSKIVKTNPRYHDVLKLSEYSKGNIYNILNNINMKVHEEHMTPNGQIQKKLLEFNEPSDFENFIRNNYAIAIITKNENQRLDDGGFRTNRANLDEAFGAYEKMGIIVEEFFLINGSILRLQIVLILM
jgi:hypothetical protein